MVWSIASVVVLLAGVGFLVWGWAFLGKHDEPIPRPRCTTRSRACAHALAARAGQVPVPGGGAVLFQVFWAASPRTTRWKASSSTASTCRSGSPTRWCAPGTSRRAVLDRHRLLAAGLFLAPLINGGKDPKYQKLGVDILFWALVVVCVGSFIGNYLAIAQKHAAGVELLAGPPGL
jgi:nitric oxide reductase subunit B